MSGSENGVCGRRKRSCAAAIRITIKSVHAHLWPPTNRRIIAQGQSFLRDAILGNVCFGRIFRGD